jgi:hypothetical protein
MGTLLLQNHVAKKAVFCQFSGSVRPIELQSVVNPHMTFCTPIMYILPNIDISTKSSENALPTKKCTKHAAYHKKVPQKNFPCMGKKSGQYYIIQQAIRIVGSGNK